mmetsp:Transcript_18109/g.35593  ORF Transcript_18109/g.35593 Transcript_18109/m.35593 type:complete len:301 (+) Transcript_18109:236-1138(+)|eukprot:CAMPEP_0171497936 /NCGR_PEP_ID=MMETSP0958-20121227/7557_1 /TAXON_ID=87120 /ORGANISM="Aurantiochytrium limacinum, Strain ATCCMYA-1381" /LENGTH=300 /DNA_ID=CAMNT_0012032251 /DNA_START=162 /DNA_END=1064 /DNA_ORIENTATION=-
MMQARVVNSALRSRTPSWRTSGVLSSTVIPSLSSLSSGGALANNDSLVAMSSIMRSIKSNSGRFMSTSASGNGGEGEDSEDAEARLKAEAERLLAAKKESELARFEAEREAYKVEMTKLRKVWKEETMRSVQAQLKDREERIRRGVERQKAEEDAFKAEQAKALAERTSLELSALEVYRETYEKELNERRALKIEKRQEVLEKLRKRQAEEEERKQAMLEALANEAHLWFTKEDLVNGSLDEKLRERLVKIQPITASWQNALPKHHHDDAKMFITDDSEMIFDEELLEEAMRAESTGRLG